LGNVVIQKTLTLNVVSVQIHATRSYDPMENSEKYLGAIDIVEPSLCVKDVKLPGRARRLAKNVTDHINGPLWLRIRA